MAKGLMCIGSKSKICPCDLTMEEDKIKDLHKNCSKLLELAAIDDLSGFVHEVEQRGCDVCEISLWYGRTFGSKKMGSEERSPIMIASLYGSLEVLKYILGTGKVDVNIACGLDQATALHCAAAGGSWSSVEAAKLLVEAGGDTNCFDANGKKPGDVIAPSVENSSNLKRKELEVLLNGATRDGEDDEEGIKTPQTPKTERKEYPIDVSLPDINHGLYGTDEFRMYSFKVKPCSRAYSHDWTECPFVHPGENARRRDPRKYTYTCVPCPEFKKGSCGKGDACEYAHGVFESWLHPAQYKTRLCKDETGCSRKVCFFAHKPEEVRPLYAATGSALPSPKSVPVNSLEMTNLTPPMSPSVNCSSPMGGGGSVWHNPPALQLSGSRLKTAFSARDVNLDVEMLGLEKIRTQQRLVEEMASLSSPYGRFRDSNVNPTNLDDMYGSYSQSPDGLQVRQNMNQMRTSYPPSVSSGAARNYGYDSSAAVASAIMNSRSAAFAKRSQSFIDRSGGSNYRSGFPGSANSPSLMQSKLPEWGSHDGRVDWGFNSDEVSKLRKSASFGFRNGNGGEPRNVDEPDVSWVNSLVRDAPSGGVGLYSSQVNCDVMPNWTDQLYMEQEQLVA